jgi:hypothetical protein
VIFSIKVKKEDKYSMTKKLEEIFDLPEVKKEKPVLEKEVDVSKTELVDLNASLAHVENVSKSLPQIQELDNLDDRDLDALATKAEQAYDDLMDLGMNVEVRYAGRIFEVAGTMMKNAIDAKSAKIDKRLKAVDLQLKKLKIDRDAGGDDDNMLNGQGYVITDRNELLKKLQGKA